MHTIFIPKIYTSFTATEGCIITRSTETTLTIPLPNRLTGIVHFKIIIKSFHSLQVGDLVAQMTLQGREGMASCRCIKCNVTKNEWKSAGKDFRLLNRKDLNSPGMILLYQYCTVKLVW